MGNTRVFISVELSDVIKKNIVELINELKETKTEVKWVKAENLHITLKFIGWIEDHQLDNLIELTTKAVVGTGSFKAKFVGLGTFPENKSPRVVWVGTEEGGDELCKLAKNLEETLSNAGFRSEARDFKPHLTIARIKKGGTELKKKIESIKGAKFGEMIIDQINIMKSTLTQKGPIYEKLKEVKL